MDPKLFVGMLSKDCAESDVETMFEPFGNIMECAILRDSRGSSKGCAFVTFDNCEESKAAIEALHGSTRMDGCKANLVVKFADSEKQRQQRYQEQITQEFGSSTDDSSNREDTKLFVGMIGNALTEEKLEDMFKSYGTVTECAILRDSDGNSRGCGFIRYSSVAESLAAIKGMSGSTKLPGANANIVVKFADSDKQRQQRLQKTFDRPGAFNPRGAGGPELDDTKIFIGMLGNVEKVEELREMFEPFGQIVDCAILRDNNTNRSKGCGFIRFSSPKEAYTAIRVMNGSDKMPGASAKLVVKFADNKKAQQQQQQQQQQPYNQGHSYGNHNMPHMPIEPGNMFPMMNSPAINQLLQQQLALTAAAMNLTTGGGQTGSVNPANQFGSNPGNQFGSSPGNQFGSNSSGPFGSNPSNNYGNGSSGNQYGTNQFNPKPDYPSSYNDDHMNSGQEGGNSLQQVLAQMNSSQGQGNQAISSPSTLQQALAQQQAFIQQALVAQQFSQPPTNQLPPAQEPNRPGPDGCNLFVMHLPKECVDHQLRQLFTPFGNVMSANIFYDKVTSESKCFGFVSFDDQSSAQNAIKSMNGFQIGGKRLKVQLKTNKKPY